MSKNNEMLGPAEAKSARWQAGLGVECGAMKGVDDNDGLEQKKEPQPPIRTADRIKLIANGLRRAAKTRHCRLETGAAYRYSATALYAGPAILTATT